MVWLCHLCQRIRWQSFRCEICNSITCHECDDKITYKRCYECIEERSVSSDEEYISGSEF